jgi:hypothetical protein
MQLAVEMGLHLDAEGQQIPEQIEGMQEVRLWTFWGAFTLNQYLFSLKLRMCRRPFGYIDDD